MTTASLLGRVSRKSDDDNLSLTGNLDDCRALAARLNADVVGVHTDDGISGGKRTRPGFEKWLADATSGRASILVAPTVDRISRAGAAVAARILDVLEETGCRLVTCDGLDSEDSAGFELMFVIKAQVARDELRTIERRAKLRVERLAREGRWGGGRVPFGCKKVKHPEGGWVLARSEPQAGQLERAADMLVRGDSVRAVIRYLDSVSTTPHGKPWRRGSLTSTLLSPAVAEHVLASSVRRAVVERLTPSGPRAGAKPGAGRPQTRLLIKGMAVCGSCGRSLVVAGNRYTCRANADSAACPSYVSVAAGPVDSYVEAEYLRRFGEARTLEAVVRLVGAEELELAEQAVQTTRAAMEADDSDANVDAWRTARRELASLQAVPLRRETEFRVRPESDAQVWARVGVPERAAMVRSALVGPVVIKPAKVRGGRFDVERIELDWKADHEDWDTLPKW